MVNIYKDIKERNKSRRVKDMGRLYSEKDTTTMNKDEFIKYINEIIVNKK